MHMSGIHACAQTVSENERLKKTLKRIKKENEEMKRKINDMEEQRKMENMLKQFVTTRNMESQTDPMKYHYQHVPPSVVKKVENTQQQDKLNKMLLMHNNLMKRYERELKTNMQHVETITTLNLRINTLEQKLKEAEIKVHQLEAASFGTQNSRGKLKSRQRKSPERRADDEEDTDAAPLLYRYGCLKKERDKLKKENEGLQQELKGLDHGFFEEVEDLKFALQQSSRLNQEYEKSLKRLCKQFGVPYPNPEKRLRDGR